ncbi:MAG: FtsX-like permease family protein [Candidatus Thermoplasmatota archaeon]|nr:FtsX-like permease family protein [Candidatus Thermoplasmatota archaeon]
MLLIRQRVVVVIALSVMVFTATISVLIGLSSAPSAFAANEGFVVTSSDAPTIFSSRVEMDLVTILDSLDNITGVSPEVFAFSEWDSDTFVVRGVDFERISSVGPAIDDQVLSGLSDGSVPDALIGDRLLSRMGFDLPATIVLVGSYNSKMDLVRISDSFSSGSPLDDELLVPLSVARYLSDTPEDMASIIRLSTNEPAWLSGLLSPESARFALFDMHISKSEVVIGESITVSASVRNWGGSEGSISIDLSVDGVSAWQISVSIDPYSTEAVSHALSFSSIGAHEIEMSIGGDFPVSLNSSVDVVEPYIVMESPGSVMDGSTFSVKVYTYDGAPVQDAIITIPTPTPSTNATDDEGVSELLADAVGEFTLVVDMTGTDYGSYDVVRRPSTIQVLDPSVYPDEFLPVVSAFSLSPLSIKESEESYGSAMVDNLGILTGVYELEVFVDGSLERVISIPLDSAQSRSVSFILDSLSPGTHVVQVGDFSMSLEVQPWFVDDSDIVRLVIRYGGSNSLSSAGSIPIYQAAKISQGNVAVALFALGAISGLLATLAIVSVFSKEVHEGRRRLGIIKAIGASASATRKLVFSQAFMRGLMGAAIGLVAGIACAIALVRSGVFVVFGHSLDFDISLGPIMMILAGAISISLVSALVSAEMAVRETAISSIRDLSQENISSIDIDTLLRE